MAPAQTVSSFPFGFVSGTGRRGAVIAEEMASKRMAGWDLGSLRTMRVPFLSLLPMPPRTADVILEEETMKSFAPFVSLAMAGFALHSSFAAPIIWNTGLNSNGHAYEVFSVPAGINWAEAETLAVSIGGHLASINSQEENEFVFSLVGSVTSLWVSDSFGNGIGPWLGGYQTPSSAEPGGGYNWTDNTPFTFANWSAQEPSNFQGNEDRIHFFGAGSPFGATWNDYPSVPSGTAQQPKPRAYVVEFLIPEPGSAALLLAGVLPLMRRRRR